MRLWQADELRRINLLEGSVSSGKTWVSLVLWAFWVKTMPAGGDSLYLMAARSLTTLKRNCLLPLQELVGRAHFSFSVPAKEGYLFGRRVILEGANDAQAEAKIRGVTLQGAYCDEATKLQPDFFAMLLSRLRKPGAKLIATTNPDAPGHWLKERYIDRADELDLLDVRFVIDDNTTLPPEYVENIKKEYTGVFYERYILGKWTMAEGLIYPMYADAIAEEPTDQEPFEYVVSLDYGTMNPLAALLWADFDGVWYAVSEYYHSGRDTNQQKTDQEYSEELNRWLDGYFAASGGRLKERLEVIVDPSAASFIALLRKKSGEKYLVRKAKNEVIDGIRETATALQTGKIKILPELTNWKKEAQGYVWDEKAREDRPVKVNDHLMDAMRYFVKTKRIAVPKTQYEPGFLTS